MEIRGSVVELIQQNGWNMLKSVLSAVDGEEKLFGGERGMASLVPFLRPPQPAFCGQPWLGWRGELGLFVTSQLPRAEVFSTWINNDGLFGWMFSQRESTSLIQLPLSDVPGSQRFRQSVNEILSVINTTPLLLHTHHGRVINSASGQAHGHVQEGATITPS